MKIAGYKISQKQLIVTIILAVGLIVTLVLVQRQQILKSRATQEIYNTFERTDSEGNPLECSRNTCETKTLDVKIKVDVEELERIANPD